MLFRKNMAPSCAYCKHGTPLGYGEVACSKRGIMLDEGKCSAFRYEPTKRRPECGRPVTTKMYTLEEMGL